MAVEYMNKKPLKGAWGALGQVSFPLLPWIFLEASHFCFLLGFFPLGEDVIAKCFLVIFRHLAFLVFKDPGLEPSNKIRSPV